MKPFDAQGVFRPIEDEGGLRRLAVRGAGATVLSSALSLVTQIVSTVVLALLLLPTDFGLVAMVTTFSLLLVNFGLNGFTEAVLQWEELDETLASNLFWINVVVGAVLTGGFAAAGSLMARFYGNSRVTMIAAGISLTIISSSISVVHLALLKRAMRFSVTAANDVFSNTISVALSIVLAWMGWGYWALVVGAVARPFTQSLGAFHLCRWVPGLPRRSAQTMPVIRFAMHIYGRFTVNYFARNLDNLLVGWRLGAQSLGFYKRAYDLFALSASQLISPLANVAVSALSRLQNDLEKYKRYLLSALGVVALIGMGVGMELTLLGKDLIRLLFPPIWAPSGQIFTFFGPGIGIMLLYGTHGWIHLSIGRADRWLRWGIIEVSVTALLFLAGIPWGASGIAVAWTASFWILTLPALWYAGKPIGLGIGPMIAVVWKYIVASLVAGGATIGLTQGSPALLAASSPKEALVGILVISCLSGVLYILAVALLHGGFTPLSQLLNLMREMAPMRRFSRRPAGVVATTCAPGSTEM